MNPEPLAPDHSVVTDICSREEPDEEKDENNDKDGGDDDEGNDGYSE